MPKEAQEMHLLGDCDNWQTTDMIMTAMIYKSSIVQYFQEQGTNFIIVYLVKEGTGFNSLVPTHGR